MSTTNMHGQLAAGVMIAVTAAASWVSVHAAKPAPPPPNWPCTITFDRTLTYTPPGATVPVEMVTAVQPDDGGAYVDGVDLVQCYVNRNPDSGNFENLFVNASSSSSRYLWMPGQDALTDYGRNGYGDFQNRQPGYFEVTDIATVVGTNERRRIRIGVGYALDFDGGLMVGDSLDSSPLVAGSASAWITAHGDGCGWDVRFYPHGAVEAGDEGSISPTTRYVALREGKSARVARTADFAMPISATVRSKADCPPPPAP
jgi:hypothetical protein